MHLIRFTLIATLWCATFAYADPNPAAYWNVDDVRGGMKGVGKTVMKGTKIEEFDAEVLGVLRNSSPGRDMILCKLSGLGLEKSGVIQGMSGSPIYIQGKLLGAVAFAWPFGKEPLAGVTPFSQMHEFAAGFEKKDLAGKNGPVRTSLRAPIRVGDRQYDSVTVSGDFSDPQPTAADGIWMVPLRTPIAVTGFTRQSLSHLREDFASLGMVPMQGGGVGSNIPEAEKNIPLQAGGALTVAMVTGDFDMSGIGTVTHIEGKRVYGWGHPFFGMGACDFPMMTGYVHTINSRVSLSFKMGSPLRNVGVINADVSTCIAGWLDRPADMMPMRVTVQREPDAARTYNVTVARPRQVMPGLVNAVLVNSIDAEGDLPEEMTARLKVKFDFADRPSLVVEDLHSGSNLVGARGPQALFSQSNVMMQLLTNNPISPVRVKNIEAAVEIMPGRRTADIDSVELDSDAYLPGETVKAIVTLRPYKGTRTRMTLQMQLPSDMAEGSYLATVSDDIANAKQELRDDPNLGAPTTEEHMFRSLNTIAAARRTTLTMRVPMPDQGVALSGQSLRDLPPSMVQILGNGRRSGGQTIAGSLVARQPTNYVLTGTDSIRFNVTKVKRVTTAD
ncbi:MAG: hypothetical protein K2X38_09935 [Gemmataceae bacterium]|nr:hypothetical protein [Gemmataceae bacterium]